jgi:hypothetical protein
MAVAKRTVVFRGRRSNTVLVSYGKFISISSSTGTCMDVGAVKAPTIQRS